MNRRGAAAGAQLLALALALSAATGWAQTPPAGAGTGADSLAPGAAVEEARIRAVIERHLGRPYAWGACGLKSFDCSGFVWRVMEENGIRVKRTTARKFYMSLPKATAGRRWTFGNIVFFSNLKHCGIVDSPASFYHAAVTAGTHLSRFDPLWRGRITGVRAMPMFGVRRSAGSASNSPGAP